VRSPLVRGALWVLALGIAAAAAVLLIFRPPDLPVVRIGGPPPTMPDPVPWREPEADLRRFFPGANSHREDVRILSGERLTLIRKLGRQPTGEENLAVLHRVMKGGRPAGVVMLRRIPGSGGSIEVVLAVAPDGRIRGLRFQRHREPEPVAAALLEWLGTFAGKTAGTDWTALPVPEAAREPAGQIVEAVRSALIVLETAEAGGIPAGPQPHH
jgi:hypothetical protein